MKSKILWEGSIQRKYNNPFICRVVEVCDLEGSKPRILMEQAQEDAMGERKWVDVTLEWYGWFFLVMHLLKKEEKL